MGRSRSFLAGLLGCALLAASGPAAAAEPQSQPSPATFRIGGVIFMLLSPVSFLLACPFSAIGGLDAFERCTERTVVQPFRYAFIRDSEKSK